MKILNMKTKAEEKINKCVITLNALLRNVLRDKLDKH